MFAYTTMWVASICMWAHQVEMRAYACYKNLQLNCHFVIDGYFHHSEPDVWVHQVEMRAYIRTLIYARYI